MSATLYGTPISTYVRTVRLALESAGVDYAIQDVGIFNGDNEADEYLSKHPFGKIPTLEIDGTTLYETDAITYYINEKYASGKFKPADTLQQARMYQIISIFNNYLYWPAVRVLTIENLVVPSQGGEPDKEKIRDAITPAQNAFKAIADIASFHPYLLGDQLTLADFYLIPAFKYISLTPQYKQVTESVPQLREWYKEVRSLDIVKKVCS